MALVFVALMMLALPVAAKADIIQLVPGESFYGNPAAGRPMTAFVVSYGVTSTADGSALAGWSTTGTVYGMSFTNGPTQGQPTVAQSELAETALAAGTQLTLKFIKPSGTPVASMSIIADPSQTVMLSWDPYKSLRYSTWFTLDLTVVNPVASASGDLGACFSMMVNTSEDRDLDYFGAMFVADIFGQDVLPPSTMPMGVAGIVAKGVNGAKATFAALLPKWLLKAYGVGTTTPAVGYVDGLAITKASPSATFSDLGWGGGWDRGWPTDYRKLVITNSEWSTHSVQFGRMKLEAPSARTPAGSIAATKPVFRWKPVAHAARYDLRVTAGGRTVLAKSGIAGLSYRPSRALPHEVVLRWQVRATAPSYAVGAWSAARRFIVN
jgi:hypothetical protein